MDVLRYAAFTDDPAGGNPAGVVLLPSWPGDEQMRATAAAVGYSETAFLVQTGERSWDVRYFAPEAEVPFCGHATIALGVVLAERDGAGRFDLATPAGDVPVDVVRGRDGWVATLTSVVPRQRDAGESLLAEALAAFGWTGRDLDPTLPPALAFAGAWHLVLALHDRGTLAAMSYDVARLRPLMEQEGLTTVQVVHREDAATFHVRDPFPVGGVIEDPATGAAAAALGGYLRDRGSLERLPARLTLHQGVDLGRPSRLVVDVPEVGGVRVSGTAVPIP